jgi:hypothetical protein
MRSRTVNEEMKCQQNLGGTIYTPTLVLQHWGKVTRANKDSKLVLPHYQPTASNTGYETKHEAPEKI